MPNDINPNAPPVFHIHYNWSSNTSPDTSRKSVILLTEKFSHSPEKLTPQENNPASCSSPEKTEQAEATSGFLSNLDLLAHTAVAQQAAEKTKSEVWRRALPDNRFKPYPQTINNQSAREKKA